MNSIEVLYHTELEVDYAEEPGEGGYASVSFADEHGNDVEIVAEHQDGLVAVLRELLAVAERGNA